ncbi:hypothetical protein FPY71_07055 [Aureimonas fodinaquatilis]|uniref:Uncharacterized protein n=1 Tax=Aureimonas fodinaquatilis TaxID=2565783 RepID=A0A5B0DVB3_9HYPH|nr:hypothetical protein [Aureimonas fodinaquatilis]KAA0970278.1 hypothetical protein FPY71_07055 [Aureimonas fodinaquatilis]
MTTDTKPLAVSDDLKQRLRRDFGDWVADPTYDTRIEAADRIEALEARNAELEAGLHPFAEAAELALISGNPPGNHVDANRFLKARALLKGTDHDG